MIQHGTDEGGARDGQIKPGGADALHASLKRGMPQGMPGETPGVEAEVDGAIDDADSVHAVLGQISEGTLAPEALAIGVRRRCVEHMTDEGFSQNDIAGVMRVSVRTIGRDRAAVRSAGAIAPSLALGDELLGEFERITQQAIQRLRRLGGDAKTPAYAKLWAAEATTRVYERFIELVKRMKYIGDGQRRLAHLEKTDPAAELRDYETRVAEYRAIWGDAGQGMVDLAMGKQAEGKKRRR